MGTRDANARALENYRRQYQELATGLAQIGFIWHGSVQTRWLTCGRPDCDCAADPKLRHGPYVYWTSKVKGQSVAKLLHAPDSSILAEWVENRQKVEKILIAMRKVSRKAFKPERNLRMKKKKK